MEELQALVILNNLPGIGPVKCRQLLSRFGSAESVLNASAESIAALEGFGTKSVVAVQEWERNSRWKQDLELIEQYGVTVIPFTSPEYPPPLLGIPDHPILLYVKGHLEQCDNFGIAIVGTRSACNYAIEMAHHIGHDLASYGVTVVSGLARGVDTAAHRGALECGRTVAVIGSGLARLYPEDNAPLARAISNAGAVISEYPMATPPDRQQFPQRNRIISGMTQGTLLVEAPSHSGAMITMNKALSQGRRLFALPGRADSPNFRGNHRLIKQGHALLIESGKDIMEALERLIPTSTGTRPAKPRPALRDDELQLLAVMPHEEVPVDEIAQIAKLPIMKLNVLLMSLVMKQQVKEFPGKLFKKIA